MASIGFNARLGITVGTSAISLADAFGNVTATTLSVAGISTLGAVSLASLNVSGVVSFSVNPTGVTSAQNTNSTTLATTAFVLGQKGVSTPIMDGVGTSGISTLFAPQDHIHPSDTSKATNTNPTLSGIVSILGGTVTTSSPFLSMSQTWNSSGIAFSGIKAIVTNTASSDTSLILDLQSGANKFGVNTAGAIVQVLNTPNIARDIVGIGGSRHVREYQDLTDDGTQGLPGTIGISTDSFEWGYTWNAKWDTTTSLYIKDRNSVGDHAFMYRVNKRYGNQWWFSDGTISGAIIWTKKIDFDFPANMYSFNGTISATNLTVSGTVNSSINLTTSNAFKINTMSVLDATTLGSGVINSSLTSVGTLITGIWNATAISVANGGTGASSQISALTNLMPAGATSGYVLTTSGSGSYYWAAPTGSTAPVGTTIQSSRTLSTATAGQTVFATPTYVQGASQLRVYINGIRQFSTEYTETTSTSFTLNAPGATLSDIVFIEVDGYVIYSLSALATAFTPSGLITATNVQSAIADLEARKISHIDTIQIGTTSLILNRSSAIQTLTGISIDGNAATATNVAYSGLTGTVPTWNQNTTGNAATATNALSLGGALANTYALLVSPALTGIPTAPTASAGTNTTQVATTSFVTSVITANQNNMTPAGTLIDFAGSIAPAGYLACSNIATNVSRNTYAALFAAIGIIWGSGDGSTTFSIPWFPDGYASIHSINSVGSQSIGQVISHTHTVVGGLVAGAGLPGSYASSTVTNTTQTSATGGTSNLAAGMRVLKCVKY